ncbi:hypothetical protein GQ53DRAFT_654643 [Thozetella sp. PMI_491]|nr:hypothetical protein GQ53DRAFT_654643 [Thozetella sp. PMI_491]
MFNLGTNPKLRGSGHLILNALRALTLIALATVMAATWIMVVFSGLTGKLFFFDMISHIFVFFITVFLAISEVGLFKNFFLANWPVLSPSHSLAWLGLAMIVIGCDVLGNLNKDVYSIGNLGLPMWRMIMAAGILCITFGFFNIFASVVFRDGENGINARQIRSDGSLAAPINKEAFYDEQYSRHDDFSRSPSYQSREEDSRGNRITRFFNVKNMRKSKIQISKPILHHDDMERGSEDHGSRSSPIMPTLQRPPTALHPALSRDRDEGSRYSEANMSRF